MDLRNSTLIHSLFIFLCIGCVHNKRRKLERSVHTLLDLNSTIYLNSFQLIQKFRHVPERHSVTTESGYKVTLFRILKKGPPVLLVHGIADSSDSWLVLGPADSLAYQLTKAGFDVWLFNSRGNKYSRNHKWNITNKQYWNFSYEEMGSEDLPSVIDYILWKTSQEKLAYVGFSQGTTIFLVMCSMRPDYNNKINHAILLAPVAWVTRLQYPLIEAISQNINQLSSLAKNSGLYELFPSSFIQNKYHAEVCNITSPLKVLCDLEYYGSYGFRNISNLPQDKLPVIASHIPAGTSTKTFVHFIQGFRGKSFQRYDYGQEQNQIKYGSIEPPTYNVTLVNVPVSIFCSESDWFSTTHDVETLRSMLPNIQNYINFNRSLDFTHLEFIYGSRVKALINDPVVRILLNLE